MSGHSKWATIKRKKAIVDAKRGQAFTKLIREISAAARTGGGNPDANPRLRVAIEKAKELNMPQENIRRAIQRGTGDGGEAIRYEEAVYEGYGPGGAAVIAEALTDNRNRTSSELRAIFTRHGGSLGEPGCVAWSFRPAGLIVFDRASHNEELLMAAAVEAGAEDFRASESIFEVVTSPDTLDQVRAALAAKGLTPTSAEPVRLPKNTVPLDGKNAEHMVRLMEALEAHDDVQRVYSNFDIAEPLMETLIATSTG
jgi:YebC/PmpR family DNA-binding regulatory protein